MGLITATIVALATLTVAPSVQFTTDSKYTSNKILTVQVQENRNEEEELVSKDLLFTENYVVGYEIYDNPDTPYIDGLKIDDAFIYNWKVENYDDSVAHTIHIKTVYTDDVAGALAAASKGDFSKVLANPLIFIQLIYFSVALIAVLASSFAALKARIKKNLQEQNFQDRALNLAEGIVTPFVGVVKHQQETILKALVLGQSGKPEDRVEMLNLLESTAKEDFSELTDNVKKSILDADARAQMIKNNAKSTIDQIAKGVFDASKAAENVGSSVKDNIEAIKHIGDDGTSI